MNTVPTADHEIVQVPPVLSHSRSSHVFFITDPIFSVVHVINLLFSLPHHYFFSSVFKLERPNCKMFFVLENIAEIVQYH